MSSLYGLDEETKQLLKLDNFLGDLTVPEFVDKLSKKNVEHKSRFNNGVEYLDPKPYIRTYELVQKELDKLSAECDSRKQRLERRSNEIGAAHSREVQKLSERALGLNDRFNTLCDGVMRLNNGKIGPLGEQLAQTNKVQEHAQQLIFLSKCYNDFYSSTVPLPLTRYQPNQMERVAKTFNQLRALSSKMISEEERIPRATAARQLIEQTSDKFEGDQLDNFKRYFKAGERERAKAQQFAKILFVYNGAKNLISSVVDGSALFTKLQQHLQTTVPSGYLTDLGNPDCKNYELDRGTAALLQTIADEFDAEIGPIVQVFQENSSPVIKQVVSKLFGDVIHQRVSYLYKLGISYSKLACVRMLHLVATETARLVANGINGDLEKYGIDLSSEVSKAYNDVFEHYLKDDAYFKLERNSLLELLDSLAVRQESKHALSDRITAFKEGHDEGSSGNRASKTEDDLRTLSPISPTRETSFKDRAKRFMPHSKRMKKFTSASGSSGWRQRLKRSVGGNSNNYQSSLSDASALVQATEAMPITAAVAPVPTGSTTTPLVSSEKMLTYVVEALNRAIELVPSKVNVYAMEIFEIMMYKFGPGYILNSLEGLYNNDIMAPKQKLKSFFGSGVKQLDMSFVSKFNTISYELYLLSVVVKKSFYPLLLTDQVKARIVNIFNGFLQDTEIGLNITLQSLLELIDDSVHTILNGQKSDDFNPRYQNPVIDKTETGDKLTKFIDNLLRTFHTALESNPSLEYELIERLFNNLLEALVDHFTKYRVNSTGSLILTQDIIHYISLIENYDVESLKARGVENTDGFNEVAERFNVLKEMSNLFSCQPALLKDLSNEGKLTTLKRSVLRDLIRERFDFRESFLNGI